MNKPFNLIIRLAALIMLGSALQVQVRAQADYIPPLTGQPLAIWQVQGEYFGTVTGGGNLGAWLVATGGSNYSVTFLPGGLLTLPGDTHGGWVQTGWNRTTFTGSGALNTTTFTVNTASNYKAAAITGTGEARTMTGVTPTGAAFTLTRVVRNSPTHYLKPKPEWGTANMWFDSATGQADLSKWANKDNPVSLSRKCLYRGVQTVAAHGAGFLHIEFQGCFNPTATGQGRANSGIYLQSHYETQVLDSFGSTGAENEYGAIYSVKEPLINASLPPLTWHTYDIYFTPRTSGAQGDATGAAVVTAYANGVLVQDATPVLGVTTAGVGGNLLIPSPLYLQNHGNEVVFNDIWFIPNATPATLPYATVLSGVVGIDRNTIKPLLERQKKDLFELQNGIQGRFDLSGREVIHNGAVLSASPVFSKQVKP